MTGQVDFDSHTSDVVAKTVETVNLLTPGMALGKEYEPAIGDVTEPIRATLTNRGVRVHRVTESSIEELGQYAARLRKVFVAVEDGDIDTACELVNALLTETGAAPVLARHDDEPWHLHFHAIDTGWAQNWAASMATSLAVVLGNPVYDRLGVCGAPSCDRVFVDTSRNGTKRFCSTACQNRVKAAAFRARRKDA